MEEEILWGSPPNPHVAGRGIEAVVIFGDRSHCPSFPSEVE